MDLQPVMPTGSLWGWWHQRGCVQDHHKASLTLSLYLSHQLLLLFGNCVVFAALSHDEIHLTCLRYPKLIVIWLRIGLQAPTRSRSARRCPQPTRNKTIIDFGVFFGFGVIVSYSTSHGPLFCFRWHESNRWHSACDVTSPAAKGLKENAWTLGHKSQKCSHTSPCLFLLHWKYKQLYKKYMVRCLI